MLEDIAGLLLPRGIKDMMLRKLFMVCVLILGMNSISYAQVLCTPESPSPPATTPNFGLYKPADGQCGWGLRWNQNADTLDSDVPNRTGTNTWPAMQTLNGGITLGGGSAGIPHGMKDFTCLLIRGLDENFHDNLSFMIAPYAMTLTDVSCECSGCLTGDCCSTNPLFAFADQGGAAITPSGTVTCTENAGSTWVSLSASANNVLAEGESVRLSTNTAGSTGDTDLVCIRYTVN